MDFSYEDLYPRIYPGAAVGIKSRKEKMCQGESQIMLLRKGRLTQLADQVHLMLDLTLFES